MNNQKAFEIPYLEEGIELLNKKLDLEFFHTFFQLSNDFWLNGIKKGVVFAIFHNFLLDLEFFHSFFFISK